MKPKFDKVWAVFYIAIFAIVVNISANFVPVEWLKLSLALCGTILTILCIFSVIYIIKKRSKQHGSKQ